MVNRFMDEARIQPRKWKRFSRSEKEFKVFLPQEIAAKVRAEAEQHGTSCSAVIRECVEASIDGIE